MVCSQITLSYARTCSHGSSTPHRVCHPAWENVFIVVCPAFCIYSRSVARARRDETRSAVELWGRRRVKGGGGEGEGWKPRGLLEDEVEKKLPGDGHDDAEYKFQRPRTSSPLGLPARTKPLYSFFGFFDPQSGRVNKLDDHPEEIPMPRRRNTVFSRWKILAASRNMKFVPISREKKDILSVQKYSVLFSF